MSIWRALADLEESHETGVICTIIRSEGSTPRHAGSKMLVFEDGRVTGSVGGGELESRIISAALEVMQDGKPRLIEFNMSDPDRGDPGVCGGRVEIYMEPISPKPTLVVVGAGHVGQAVAHLAHWLGFRVVVSDDRPEFCDPEVIPEADEFYPCPLEELSDKFTITRSTYMVLTTRSVDIDVPGLPTILDSPAAYVGVIGSRRRWETARKQLEESGVQADQLERVQSPMGLDISAETPEEIAVSIMAEIIRTQRRNAVK
jgi:xanthine dehydrogenase accessory factor